MQSNSKTLLYSTRAQGRRRPGARARFVLNGKQDLRVPYTHTHVHIRSINRPIFHTSHCQPQLSLFLYSPPIDRVFFVLPRPHLLFFFATWTDSNGKGEREMNKVHPTSMIQKDPKALRCITKYSPRQRDNVFLDEGMKGGGGWNGTVFLKFLKKFETGGFVFLHE